MTRFTTEQAAEIFADAARPAAGAELLGRDELVAAAVEAGIPAESIHQAIARWEEANGQAPTEPLAPATFHTPFAGRPLYRLSDQAEMVVPKGDAQRSISDAVNLLETAGFRTIVRGENGVTAKGWIGGSFSRVS